MNSQKEKKSTEEPKKPPLPPQQLVAGTMYLQKMSNFERKLEKLKKERLDKHRELGKIPKDDDSDASSGDSPDPKSTAQV